MQMASTRGRSTSNERHLTPLQRLVRAEQTTNINVDCSVVMRHLALWHHILNMPFVTCVMNTAHQWNCGPDKYPAIRSKWHCRSRTRRFNTAYTRRTHYPLLDTIPTLTTHSNLQLVLKRPSHSTKWTITTMYMWVTMNAVYEIFCIIFYSLMFLYCDMYISLVSIQLHAKPTAVWFILCMHDSPFGKNPKVPLNRRVKMRQSLPRHVSEEKCISPSCKELNYPNRKPVASHWTRRPGSYTYTLR
jgi:hypothetical protein